MGTEKVDLTKEKETLLVTLYCKALESRAKDPIAWSPAGPPPPVSAFRLTFVALPAYVSPC
ncbi:uncharacterized protein SOCE836_083300 [Sorangium cellulosum]|uniref:Uncharacterized protein n=1 Tax=Sorangium cellulosum TaxID=56 RepID=A0A4P2QZR2_SORCE|nr:uncharacterized protein SOCE836_083300 [Sorangium cellulosum]WCQ95427.1 hypothetical protein NQZ70_08203 [Sorangium sp. Soce836]